MKHLETAGYKFYCVELLTFSVDIYIYSVKIVVSKNIRRKNYAEICMRCMWLCI